MKRGRRLEGCIFSPTRSSPSLNPLMKISVCFVGEGECKGTHLKCKKYPLQLNSSKMLKKVKDNSPLSSV